MNCSIARRALSSARRPIRLTNRVILPTIAARSISSHDSQATDSDLEDSSEPAPPKPLNDILPFSDSDPQPSTAVDWSRSFHGLSTTPFPSEIAQILTSPLADDEIECKPDGLLYLPEIRYRRILNKAFGPGGWGLAPRGETYVTSKTVSREYALVCHGRLVSVARGEQEFFGPDGVATATEGCKSNALMRCCKDLGIASELWDPSFIRGWKREHCTEQFTEHVVNKKKRKLWRRKDTPFEYPFKPISY